MINAQDGKNGLDRRNGLQKLHAVLNYLKLKIRELADIETFSIGRVHYSFHDDLGMANLSARWVPRLLNVDQKHQTVNFSHESLAFFKLNSTDFPR